MKKDIEWLNEQVGELNSTDAVFNESGASYIDTAVSIDRVYELINQLDEPEVLSQDWIDEHKVSRINNLRKMTMSDVVPVDKLQDLLVPKQELPVIPKYVAEYLEFAKSDVPLKRVMEIANTRDEWPKWRKEYDWISANDETFARAWLDGYEVEEEPLYYALIKGHELIAGEDACKYWKCDMRNGSMFLSNRYSHYGRYLAEMSENDWGKFGINNTNADFVRVDD